MQVIFYSFLTWDLYKLVTCQLYTQYNLHYSTENQHNITNVAYSLAHKLNVQDSVTYSLDNVQKAVTPLLYLFIRCTLSHHTMQSKVR